MNQSTISSKVYYFFFCNPNLSPLATRRSISGNYKAIAAEREAKRKEGYECGFIYHYTEQVVTFSK